MIRSLLLFFTLLLSLYGMSDAELLKEANYFVKSSTKSNQFRAYNEFKNLYLRTFMKENSKIKIQALEGIVKSGTQLHIDVSPYVDALQKYQSKKSQHRNNIKVKPKDKLQSIHWLHGRLLLTFHKRLRDNQINYFKLYDSKTRKYKYIFEVEASMRTKSQMLRKNGVDNIELSQFKPNKLRLVIKNSEKLKINFQKKSASLVIKITPTVASRKKSHKERVQQPPQRLDRDKIIVIDPGHGGKDPGAIGYRKYREKDVVLKIGKYLRKILKSRGYKVYMTRDADYFVTLRNRTRYANRKKADLFISIHANAVSGTKAYHTNGIESYFLDKSRSSRAKKVASFENRADMGAMDFYGKESFLNTLNSHNIIAANKLAIDLQRGVLGSLIKHYKYVKDAGVREGPFWVLVGAQMPAVLVETGFITNPQEAKRLVNSKYQQRLALGLANGIERYFMNN